MKEYLPRLVDSQLQRQLGALGGVVLEGPRATGKTMTATRHANSSIRLDSDPQILAAAELNPGSILQGRVPRAIDEWQLAPTLWNAARHEIDDRGQTGQFILTGSATPADDVTRHSGAGRFGRLAMRPMTLFESRESTGSVSFAEVTRGLVVGGIGGPTVPEYADLCVRGGWPALVVQQSADPEAYLASYLDNIVRADVAIDSARPDPVRMRALVRAIARNTATEVSLTRLAAEAEISTVTVRAYLDALIRVFVLEEQPAWSPKLRSKVRLRVKPKIHLVDPSLALSALGVTAARLLADLQTFGFIFESLCVRDLRSYAGLLGGNVAHYRDSNGLEIDAIVDFPNGSWSAFEVKLGGVSGIETAARNLKQLVGKVSDAEHSRLGSLNVLTGGVASYTRPDGVNVIALGHLAP